MQYVKDNWAEIKRTCVNPVWIKHGEKFKRYGIEEDDFTGISYMILCKAFQNYNPAKSKFSTFAQNVLNRKMYSYIRDISDTDKTRINYMCNSLESLVDDESNSSFMDMLADNKHEDESNINKIWNYLKQMSNTQKNIITLRILGFADDEIISVLPVSLKEYQEAVKSMSSRRNTAVLRKRGN